MRHITTLAAIIATAAITTSCDKYYDGYYDEAYYETSTEFMTLRNYSSEATVWFIPAKENAEKLPDQLSEWQKISIYEIGAKSATTISFDSDDNYVTPVETYSSTDRLVIYVFPKKIWDEHSWSELVEGQMWTGKCSYTVEEMIATNKIVTYPMR